MSSTKKKRLSMTRSVMMREDLFMVHDIDCLTMEATGTTRL